MRVRCGSGSGSEQRAADRGSDGASGHPGENLARQPDFGLVAPEDRNAKAVS